MARIPFPSASLRLPFGSAQGTAQGTAQETESRSLSGAETSEIETNKAKNVSKRALLVIIENSNYRQFIP
ncbi:MAG: hypothetical protein Q7J34_14215 [Bacteroidales bacterium]|nr:hypothetical protein [Bacteroidales bacterium]